MPLSFTRRLNRTLGVDNSGDIVDAAHINELQVALEGITTGTQPIPLAGIEGALGAYEPLANMRAGVANVLDYGADATGVADSRAAIINAQAAGNPYFPPGDYRITEIIPGISNRTWTFAPGARLINDRTNASPSKQACILAGNMHPAYLDYPGLMTGYDLDPIAVGDRAVDCDTTADALNFAVSELVFVGDSVHHTDNNPRHAQLNKISSISSGTITLRDPIAVAIAAPKIWKFNGTDGDTDQPCYAVENFHVIGGEFQGRSAFATKSAVYNGSFRNIHTDCFIFAAFNALAHVLLDDWRGTYSNRYIDLGNNCFDVKVRDWAGEFTPPTVDGDAQADAPILIEQRAYGVVLENMRCYLGPDFTGASLSQLKGTNITVRNPDWVFAGSGTGATVHITDSSPAYAGFPSQNILIDGGRITAEGMPRVLWVGSGASEVTALSPDGVEIRGTEIGGTPTAHSIWFSGGTNLLCSAVNRTSLPATVSEYSSTPDFSGYRGTME